MIKKSKRVAFLLILSLILAMLPTTSKADTTGKINAWFSNDETGGLYLYAHPSQTVTLNYNYVGDFSTFKTKINVFDEGGSTILSEVYTNTPKNQVSITLPEAEGLYTATVTVTSGMNSVTDRAEISVVEGMPTIESQPSSVTTEAQQDVVFQVSSREPATYQWFRTKAIDEEGIEISGAASPNLCVTAQNVVASANGDYFYCKISASGKSITSNYARLLIKGMTLPTETPGTMPDVTFDPSETENPTAPTEAPTRVPATNPPLPSETPGEHEVIQNGIWTLVTEIVKVDGRYSGILKDGTDRTVIENIGLEYEDPGRIFVFQTVEGGYKFVARRTTSEIGNSIWVAQKDDYFAVYPIPTFNPTPSQAPIPTPPASKKTSAPQNHPSATPAGTPSIDAAIVPRIRYDTFPISGKYNGAKNRVEFTWDVRNDGLAMIEIFRSTQKDGPYQVLGKPTKASYCDTTVEPNKVYYYRVSYIKKNNNIYTYYMSNTCTIHTKPNPTVKAFKATKKRRKLILNWKYGMYANRVAVYVKTGKKWTKAGTTTKSTCKMTIPSGYKKVKARIRPYNLIKGKKYYGRYSKTITVSFVKKKR